MSPKKLPKLIYYGESMHALKVGMIIERFYYDLNNSIVIVYWRFADKLLVNVCFDQVRNHNINLKSI